MHRLFYPIVDCDVLALGGLDAVAFCERVLAHAPARVQLRAKSASPRDTLALARRLVRLCRAAGVPFYLNDRPDLARLAECDGVHVGQEDLSVADVRQFDPALRVGVSTHNLSQVSAALTQGPDYLALGPIFATSSKENPEPVAGLEMLKLARQACVAVGVPLVAIGGITAASVREVLAQADEVAVIGALVGSSMQDCERRIEELRAATVWA